MAALVISVYKNDDFSMSEFNKYREFIEEQDVDVIRKLGIILRIAESLDRSKSSCVTGIVCDVLGDSVIMKTEIVSDADLEIKEAKTAAQDFKRVFKKNLDILYTNCRDVLDIRKRICGLTPEPKVRIIYNLARSRSLRRKRRIFKIICRRF